MAHYPGPQSPHPWQQQSQPLLPPQKPKRPWPRRFWGWYRARSKRTQMALAGTFLVIVILGIFSALAQNPNSTDTTSTSSSASVSSTPTQAQAVSVTPTPTQRPQPKPMSQQVAEIVANAGLTGHVKETSYKTDGTVTITEDLGDGSLTNDLTVTLIKEDCFNVMKTLWTSGINSRLSDVTMNITMNVIDQYGKESNSQVASCELTQSTEQLFVWANLDQDMAWNDYDSAVIAPFLTK